MLGDIRTICYDEFVAHHKLNVVKSGSFSTIRMLSAMLSAIYGDVLRSVKNTYDMTKMLDEMQRCWKILSEL